MANKEVGKVSHWYDKIGVAVVTLTGPLKVGDQIKVRRGDQEFDADIISLQVDHKDVPSAKASEEVAIKLPQKAKEGSVIEIVQ